MGQQSPIDEMDLAPAAGPLADGLLLERFTRAGNQEAFAALMKRHGQPVFQQGRLLIFAKQLPGELAMMKIIGVALSLALSADNKDFYQDFRGKDIDRENFKVTVRDGATLTPETEGLRITLTAEQTKPGPVGVTLSSPIKGDFEVTTRYELLEAKPPTSGFGVGFSIYLTTESVSREATEFFRLIRANGSDVYACSRLTTTPEGRRAQPPGLRLGDIPASGKSGRLRITRKGAEAVLSAAEEDSQEFRELYRFDLGTEDAVVRLAANPGNAPNPLDLRIGDLRIRAKDLPTSEPAAQTSRGRWLWVLALLCGLGLVLGGLFAWWRKRGDDVGRPS